MIVLADASLDLSGLDGGLGELTGLMTAFTNFVSHGGEKIAQMEAAVAGSMLAFQLFRMIIETGLGANISRGLLTFVCSFCWYKVATNAAGVAQAFTAWIGSMGSFFSGGTLEGNIMNNPSLFIDLGLHSFNKILQMATQFNWLLAAAAVIVYTLIGFFVEFCYIAMAVIVVFVVIQSTLKMMIGVALVPFVIEREVRFLAAKGFGMIIDAGIPLAAASIAIGVSYGYLMNLKLGDDPSVRDCIRMAIIAFGCGVVSGGAALVRSGAGVAIERYEASTSSK